MLAGFALSFILINVSKDDFKGGFSLDNRLRKELIEEMDFNPKVTLENVRVNLKTFEHQITNEFEDSLHRICLSLQTGFKFEWYFYKTLEYPIKTLMEIYRTFLKHSYTFCRNVLIMHSKELECIGGLCYNHSYFINYSELEETLHKPKDKYLWFKYPEGLELQSRDVYRLFPKELVSFPSKDYVIQDKDKIF